MCAPHTGVFLCLCVPVDLPYMLARARARTHTHTHTHTHTQASIVRNPWYGGPTKTTTPDPTPSQNLPNEGSLFVEQAQTTPTPPKSTARKLTQGLSEQAQAREAAKLSREEAGGEGSIEEWLGQVGLACWAR